MFGKNAQLFYVSNPTSKQQAKRELIMEKNILKKAWKITEDWRFSVDQPECQVSFRIGLT